MIAFLENGVVFDRDTAVGSLVVDGIVSSFDYGDDEAMVARRMIQLIDDVPSGLDTPMYWIAREYTEGELDAFVTTGVLPDCYYDISSEMFEAVEADRKADK